MVTLLLLVEGLLAAAVQPLSLTHSLSCIQRLLYLQHMAVGFLRSHSEVCVDVRYFIIWSLTLREERRLRVFENSVLRRVFGPKRDEVTGEWRKLHNEELKGSLLLTQYCAGGKIEKNEMGGACGTYGGGERCSQGSSGET